MESAVANRVTSHPRATRPSVILLATVSHAPYCRGGVLHATGDKTAMRFDLISIHQAPLLIIDKNYILWYGDDVTAFFTKFFSYFAAMFAGQGLEFFAAEICNCFCSVV